MKERTNEWNEFYSVVRYDECIAWKMWPSLLSIQVWCVSLRVYPQFTAEYVKKNQMLNYICIYSDFYCFTRVCRCSKKTLLQFHSKVDFAFYFLNGWPCLVEHYCFRFYLVLAISYCNFHTHTDEEREIERKR